MSEESRTKMTTRMIETPESGELMSCLARALVATATAATLTLTMSACGDSEGFGPEGTGTVRVMLAGTDAGAGASLSTGAVGLEDVSAIEVTVTGVEVHVGDTDIDGESEEPGGWFDLAIQGDPPRIDLLDLTVTEPVRVAAGELDVGQEVNRVRLFIETPRITFTRDVTFPPTGPEAEVICEQGTPCPFTVPSADETGLKVDVADFTVGEDEVITVQFDDGATVQGVVISANGVMVPPVLTEGNESEEEL